MSDFDQPEQVPTDRPENSDNGRKKQPRRTKSHLKIVEDARAAARPAPNILGGKPELMPPEPPLSIPKPDEFSLDRFKSKRNPKISGVSTLLTALPHHKLSDTGDWARLHPSEEEYWSPELCFVIVPIKGQKGEQLHLIDEELAERYLPSARIQRHCLALATKPHDVFFLCHVPSQNLDNIWNESNLLACQQAKIYWVQAASRKAEGAEGYKIEYAHDPDAFPEPSWPKQTLNDLILVTFTGRIIDRADHAGLLRLRGAKQVIS
jgi:hypothetical protein